MLIFVIKSVLVALLRALFFKTLKANKNEGEERHFCIGGEKQHRCNISHSVLVIQYLRYVTNSNTI
jgi:hypothetical protein